MSANDDLKPNGSNIINGAYHASTVSALMLTNSWLMRRFLKIKPADLTKLDGEDVGKLILSMYGATWIRDWLVKKGILPDMIMDPPAPTSSTSSSTSKQR